MITFFIAVLFLLAVSRTSTAWADQGSSSDSQSTQSSSTTTTSEDNRVAADSGAVALGAGASLVNNNNFSDNVKAVVLEALNLAKDAGTAAVGFSETAIAANEKATGAFIDAQSQGNGTILKQLAPYLVLAILGIFLILYFARAKK